VKDVKAGFFKTSKTRGREQATFFSEVAGMLTFFRYFSCSACGPFSLKNRNRSLAATLWLFSRRSGDYFSPEHMIYDPPLYLTRRLARVKLEL